MKKYFKLMRVHHYFKNLLIFFPLVFSEKLFTIHTLYVFYGFVAFSILSSVIYIINDIKDCEEDRLHVTKKNRPIASGSISKSKAIILAFILIILTLFFSFQASSYAVTPLICLIAYFVINILYSFGLKKIPILDISIIVTGFLLRVLYGGLIINTSISQWLYLTIMSIAFYFAVGKRRNEKQNSTQNSRSVLNDYSSEFLNKNMYPFLTLGITFYSLWCLDTSTPAYQQNSHLILTVPLVIIILLKYNLTIESNSDGDPIEVLLHDKILLGLVIIYGIIMLSILYLFK